MKSIISVPRDGQVLLVVLGGGGGGSTADLFEIAVGRLKLAEHLLLKLGWSDRATNWLLATAEGSKP